MTAALLRPALAFGFAGLLLAPIVHGQIDRARPRVPVLVVSGANNHDWQWTHRSLVEILEESGLFEVSLTLEPAKDLADRELLARQRALVLDWNGPRWGEAAEAAFLEAVEAGLGVTVVHAANNAFDGWVEYEQLVGLLWRQGTGHGRFHPFDVRLVDRDHPVTRQLPDLRAHPDELYHRLVNTQGTALRVLGQAFSDPETGGTGADEPMVIVGRYGAGRVFHTPLGHVWAGDESLRASHYDPQFRALIVRGTEWAATGRVSDVDPDAGRVPAELARLGWRSLCDGASLAGWQTLAGGEPSTTGWRLVDGALVNRPAEGRGDLVTRAEFGDFELTFEFLLTPGANSGVKQGIATEGLAIGPEFQLVDAPRHPDGADPKHTTGALYDVLAPAVLGGGEPLQNPPDRWNAARIVRRGTRIEHWLNGRRLVAADTSSAEWKAAVAASKFASALDFGKRARGRILLQDHGDEVWFRNLFVRTPEDVPGEPVALFDGSTLEGWKALGDAVYATDAGAITGRVGGGGQSFLASEREFGDFALSLELRNEDAGNSGLQFRSHATANGRLQGYQMEIDPSERAWSGGLYDEARRGWLQDLSANAAGRAAFRPGEWNEYRLECAGPWLRAWVNGVPTMDLLDPMDAQGVFGLQVHAGNNTDLRWQDFRLRALPPLRRETRPLTWRALPGENPCPLGRGDDHRHLSAELDARSCAALQTALSANAARVGVLADLVGGDAPSAPPALARLLTGLVEGAPAWDGDTLAFVVELPDAERNLSVAFLDGRLAVHRGGTRVFESDAPRSAWGTRLRLVQCVAIDVQGASDADGSAELAFYE